MLVWPVRIVSHMPVHFSDIMEHDTARTPHCSFSFIHLAPPFHIQSWGFLSRNTHIRKRATPIIIRNAGIAHIVFSSHISCLHNSFMI